MAMTPPPSPRAAMARAASAAASAGCLPEGMSSGIQRFSSRAWADLSAPADEEGFFRLPARDARQRHVAALSHGRESFVKMKIVAAAEVADVLARAGENDVHARFLHEAVELLAVVGWLHG